MQVSVTYTHPDGPLPELDKKVTNAFKRMGLKWSDEGFDFMTGEREITFDYGEEDEEE